MVLPALAKSGNSLKVRQMRFVIQRVQSADVKIDGRVSGKIGKGFLVLIGICTEDNEAVAEPRSKVSILDGFKTVFTTPTALMLTIGFSAFIFVITGYMTWVPAYLQEEFGQNQEMAGLHSMLWTYVAAFLGVLLAGTVSDKWGAKDHKVRMFIQGAGLILGSLFLFFMGNISTLWVLYLSFAGWGFFRAFFDANIYAALYDVTPKHLHASCSSAMIMTGFAVGALAPVVLGAMKESMGSLTATFPLLGIIWAVAGVALLAVARLRYQKDYDKINTI